jgi:hypothetical protein
MVIYLSSSIEDALLFRDNLNHAIMILLNWRYAILTHMSVTVVAPTCQ